MSTNSIRRFKGKFPHVEFLTLDGEGKVARECAIVKEDNIGNIMFIDIQSLDQIDRQRLFDIIKDRNAPNFALWDLMFGKTLGNGINALVYFHQLVKQLTPQGVVTSVGAGQLGLQAESSQVTLNSPSK